MSDSGGCEEFASADEGDDLDITLQQRESLDVLEKEKISSAVSEIRDSEKKMPAEILQSELSKEKVTFEEEYRKEKCSEVKQNPKNKKRQEKKLPDVIKEENKQSGGKRANKRKNKKKSVNTEIKDDKTEVEEKSVEDSFKIEESLLDKLELNNTKESSEIDNESSTKLIADDESNHKEYSVNNNVHNNTFESEKKIISECEANIEEISSSNDLSKDDKTMLNSETQYDDKKSHLSTEENEVLDKLSGVANKGSGWGWGSWGASLLSTATSSVSTFTSHVGQGFATVLETVEGTLGAPSPEELAAVCKTEKSSEDSAEGTAPECKSDHSDDSTSLGSKIPLPGAEIIFSGVTNLTSVIQNTSKHLVSGSLDALETIGKKTMDILQEGDPGLKKKRALFQGDKGDLSQILREAKQKAEIESQLEEDQQELKKAHFGLLFDNFQGLAHLEALEMLSSQCDSKLKATITNFSGDKLSAINNLFGKFSETCSLDELDENIEDTTDHEFRELVTEMLNLLNLGTSPEKLIVVQKSARSWLDECKNEQDKGHAKEAKDIHDSGISSLAELTARAIEQFHKSSELLLLQSGASNQLHQASSLTKLTNVLCKEISILSEKYAECLNTAADDSEDPDSITPLITDMYLEASNSSTYIQDAFQLTIPVLQLSALSLIC